MINIDKDITKHYYNFTDSIKSSYSKSVAFINSGLDLYFFQIQHIEDLRKQINENNNYKLLYQSTQNELDKMLTDLNSTSSLEFDTVYTEVLSYTNLNDYSKVVLNKPIPENKIFPILTPKGYSAGIAINEQGRSIGLLNNNSKCNYAVFIGNQNAPGITSGINEKGQIIIKHIPIWFNIKEGENVITSGMDRIFPTGIEVGEVVGVKSLTNTKEAYIKPHIDALTKKHFYMVEKK
jgi:rod shape-determining protein MreC